MYSFTWQPHLLLCSETIRGRQTSMAFLIRAMHSEPCILGRGRRALLRQIFWPTVEPIFHPKTVLHCSVYAPSECHEKFHIKFTVDVAYQAKGRMLMVYIIDFAGQSCSIKWKQSRRNGRDWSDVFLSTVQWNKTVQEHQQFLWRLR